MSFASSTNQRAFAPKKMVVHSIARDVFACRIVFLLTIRKKFKYFNGFFDSIQRRKQHTSNVFTVRKNLESVVSFKHNQLFIIVSMQQEA